MLNGVPLGPNPLGTTHQDAPSGWSRATRFRRATARRARPLAIAAASAHEHRAGAAGLDIFDGGDEPRMTQVVRAGAFRLAASRSSWLLRVSSSNDAPVSASIINRSASCGNAGIDRHQLEAALAKDRQRSFVGPTTGILRSNSALHTRLEVHRAIGRVPAKRHISRRRVTAIGAANRIEHDRAIFNGRQIGPTGPSSTRAPSPRDG